MRENRNDPLHWKKIASLTAVLALLSGLSLHAYAETVNTKETDQWTAITVTSKGEIKVDDGTDVWIKASDIAAVSDNLNLLGEDYKESRFRIRNNIAADYSSTKAYEAGSYVIYEGKLYVCTKKITIPEDWNSSHWRLTSMQTEDKNLNIDVDDLYDNVTRIDKDMADVASGRDQIREDFSGWFE